MDPYLGEIRLFAGPYVPEGWVACNGQLLSVNMYQALYSLLGIAYGGDGRTTFGLPNLQMQLAVGQSSTIPPGMANTYVQGKSGGAYSVGLTEANLSQHTHVLCASSAQGGTTIPGETVTFAKAPTGYTNYVDGGTPPLVNLAATALTGSGGGAAHTNIMPVLAITYIMSVAGIYPTFN